MKDKYCDICGQIIKPETKFLKIKKNILYPETPTMIWTSMQKGYMCQDCREYMKIFRAKLVQVKDLEKQVFGDDSK